MEPATEGFDHIGMVATAVVKTGEFPTVYACPVRPPGMADVTIDMENRELEDAADELAATHEDLDPGETLTVDLRNLDASTAFAFFEGALDAGYRLTITDLSAEPTGNQTILQMLQDDEIIHISELSLELAS